MNAVPDLVASGHPGGGLAQARADWGRRHPAQRAGPAAQDTLQGKITVGIYGPKRPGKIGETFVLRKC